MRWKVDIPETYKGSQHHRVYITVDGMPDRKLVLMDLETAATALEVPVSEVNFMLSKGQRDALPYFRPEYAKDLKKRLEK